MDTTPQDHIKLRQTLERLLDCPTAETLEELRSLAAAYQTSWIERRAGVAPKAEATAVRSSRKPPQISADDRAVLVKLAKGWRATPADVPRWVWLEDRELVRMETAPDGAEILALTDLGRIAAN